MKSTTLLLIHFFAFFAIKAEVKITKPIHLLNGNTTDTAFYPFATYDSINLNQYYNKPVDSFLAHLPAGYILSPLLPLDNLKCRGQIRAKYGNNIEFYIFVKNFQYMTPCSFTGTWDVTLFRKENIGWIELFKMGDCLKGCDDF